MAKDFPSYPDKNHFGLCLRASKDLEKGTIVASANFEKTDNKYIANHPSEEYKYVALMDLTSEGLPIWGKVTGQWRYCNHSCDPNCDINEKWEIVTNRAIKAHEELTTSYDALIYGFEWPEYWNFECKCNAYNCKKIINKYRLDMVYPIMKFKK